MTTAGQRLVSLSGLPSGSALTHLLAITTGTGNGETIYAHRMLVVTEQRAMAVTNRAKRTTQTAEVEASPKPAQSQGGKYAYALTKTDAIAVLTSDDEVFVLDKVSSETVSTKDDAVNISRRRI